MYEYHKKLPQLVLPPSASTFPTRTGSQHYHPNNKPPLSTTSCRPFVKNYFLLPPPPSSARSPRSPCNWGPGGRWSPADRTYVCATLRNRRRCYVSPAGALSSLTKSAKPFGSRTGGRPNAWRQNKPRLLWASTPPRHARHRRLPTAWTGHRPQRSLFSVLASARLLRACPSSWK